MALVGPPREREDVAARGAAVRGRRDQPARLGGRRHDGLGRRRRTRRRARCRSRRRSRRSSGSDRKVNLIDTPGEPSFVADALGALRVCESRRVRRQRRDGRRGLAPQRLWQRAAELGVARLVFVNMLDRERADFFRTLDSLKAAFGPHVVATEIPIGSEHEVARRDRPRRHEGLRVRRRRARATARRSRSPTTWPTLAAGVPREADGRGRRELRRADGALPRGRGDLARRDRRARSRTAPTTAHIFPVTCGVATTQPRHRPAARRDRRRPALAGPARRRSSSTR